MIKRIADWLEKMSIAAFAVGIFQSRTLGVIIGVISLIISLWISYRLENKEKRQ